VEVPFRRRLHSLMSSHQSSVIMGPHSLRARRARTGHSLWVQRHSNPAALQIERIHAFRKSVGGGHRDTHRPHTESTIERACTEHTQGTHRAQRAHTLSTPRAHTAHAQRTHSAHTAHTQSTHRARTEHAQSTHRARTEHTQTIPSPECSAQNGNRVDVRRRSQRPISTPSTCRTQSRLLPTVSGCNGSLVFCNGCCVTAVSFFSDGYHGVSRDARRLHLPSSLYGSAL
jgi:hypothetical protein